MLPLLSDDATTSIKMKHYVKNNEIYSVLRVLDFLSVTVTNFKTICWTKKGLKIILNASLQ